MTMNEQQVTELILQALEAELCCVEIYECAIECAVHPLLRREWEARLDARVRHVAVVEDLCRTFAVDPARETPGRAVVRHIGKSLVAAMEMALDTGTPAAAQLVACECVVLAETRDHDNRELIGQCGKDGDGERAVALRAAYDDIEDVEDEHLYRTKGWWRELWIKSLGLDATHAQASARNAHHLGETGPVVAHRASIA